MRRWLSIFLVIVLPLQISWALAATYCQHETGSAQRFGHHDHKHDAEDNEKLAKASPADVDNDCAVCHAGSIAALTAFCSSLPEIGVVADHFQTVPFLNSLVAAA
ncbi:hypothetical protein [Dechloromonas sp. A34]|uniref:hypothetical protein n=1 Tax=Dechloromonas sp. A34 TaxID=447588 RepID=UPI0022491460|nr:hypothetical protein [Dechloromonas sp. A34]